MPKANIVYVNVEQSRFDEDKTQLSIGFDVEGDSETKWMRYVVAGGTEGQQKFASMQLSKLLKMGGPYKVRVEANDRGYEDVYADDGFRKGGDAASARRDDDDGDGF